MAISLGKFIEAYTSPSDRVLEHNPNAKFYEGHVSGDSDSLLIPEGFQEVTAWRDGRFGAYRRVWINHDLLAEVSYTEGDVYVVISQSHNEYVKQLEHAAFHYETGKFGYGSGNLADDLVESGIPYPEVKTDAED